MPSSSKNSPWRHLIQGSPGVLLVSRSQGPLCGRSSAWPQGHLEYLRFTSANNQEYWFRNWNWFKWEYIIQGAFFHYFSPFSAQQWGKTCSNNEELFYIGNFLKKKLWLAASRFSFRCWKWGGTVKKNLVQPDPTRRAASWRLERSWRGRSW